MNENMPESFRITNPFTRATLDCTEEKVQTPSSKVLNSQIYSNYKNHTTFKGLIGITPCGTVSFISSVYTGWISDKEITARSGILDLLHVLIYISNEINVYLGSSSRAPQNLLTLFWLKFCLIIFTIILNFDLD